MNPRHILTKMTQKMNSPKAEAPVDTVMSLAHDASSSSDVVVVGPRLIDKPVQLTAFTVFRKLPKEIQDMIWDEAVKAPGQQSIHFVQIYSNVNRQGRETSTRARLDRLSTAAYLARIMPTCRALKGAIERSFNLAVAAGEQFHPVSVSVRSGGVQVQVNTRRDVVSFGMLDDGSSFTTGDVLPTNRGSVARPASAFSPFRPNNAPGVPAQWSWIRRVAINWPLYGRPVQALALAGACPVRGGSSGSGDDVCSHCVTWNLAGLRGLEEVIFIAPGLPRPSSGENPCRLLTKISADLLSGPGLDWDDLDPRCDEFRTDLPDGCEESVNEEEFELGKSAYWRCS